MIARTTRFWHATSSRFDGCLSVIHQRRRYSGLIRIMYERWKTGPHGGATNWNTDNRVMCVAASGVDLPLTPARWSV
jgi:hypothetical protein